MSNELSRYARQTCLPEVGLEGQKRLSASSVLLIGVGGLGCPAALYLAAAGVGRLGLVDDDLVSLSNLQRQILFKTAEVGVPKVQAARKALLEQNPEIQVETYQTRLNAENAVSLFSQFDVILDGTDNFYSKYLINDAAVRAGKPVVYGSISQFEGQLSVFGMPSGPCFRCLYPLPPEAQIQNCAEAGVFGALAGTIGALQAMEALKLILGAKSGLVPAVGRLFVLDTATLKSFEFGVHKNPECRVCGAADRSQIPLPQEAEFSHCAVPGAGASAPEEIHEITCEELERDLARYYLIDVREPWEFQTGAIPGARNIPLSTLDHEVPRDLPRERPIVVYCHLGMRSLTAAEILRQRGYADVRSLRSGIARWNGPVTGVRG